MHAALRPLSQQTYRLRVSVQQRHLAVVADSGPVGVNQKGLMDSLFSHEFTHPLTHSSVHSQSISCHPGLHLNTSWRKNKRHRRKSACARACCGCWCLGLWLARPWLLHLPDQNRRQIECANLRATSGLWKWIYSRDKYPHSHTHTHARTHALTQLHGWTLKVYPHQGQWSWGKNGNRRRKRAPV